MTAPAHPWRRVARTVLANLATFLVTVPIIVTTLGIDTSQYPKIGIVLAGITAVSAALTRVLAIPAVNEWLSHTVNWLSAGDVADNQVAAYVDPSGAIRAGDAVTYPTDTEVVLSPVTVPGPEATPDEHHDEPLPRRNADPA